MSDISASIALTNPRPLFTDTRSFRALANGRVFVGIPDTDPTIPGNQIPVYIENEDGSHVQIQQPLIINSAGMIVYGGQVVKIVMTQNYSIAIYNQYNTLVDYVPDFFKGTPLLINNAFSEILAAGLVNEALDNLPFRPEYIPASVVKTIPEAIYDQIIDVKWFGAKGDWNMSTQTGTDDTAAIQAAINYYATLGSRRTGGKRAIKIPYGNYKVTALTIPQGIGFGLDIIGDGMMSTVMWFDNNNSEPAFNCVVELTTFRNLSLIGSLSDQNGGSSSLWKSVCFKGKQYANRADIDVKFENVYAAFWNDFTQINGRGCVINNCAIGFVNAVINIVASPDTLFTAGSYFNSQYTGMRHYTSRNNRYDVVTRIIKVTGTGPQKDYINDILINGDDYAQCNILIDAPDAIIRRSNITGNNAVASFSTGVVQIKSSISCQMVSNNWSNSFDDTLIPTLDSECIRSLWTTTGGANGLLIHDNTVKNLAGNVVTAGASSSDVSISDNNFAQAWTFSNGTNHFVFYSPVNCDGLRIVNNGFSASSQSGSYFMYDSSVQNSRKTRVQGNSAPWSWQDYRLRYTPKILINGVASASSMTAQGRYEVTDGKVYADVLISGSPAETTGNISLSLPPINAVVQNATISTRYSGGGELIRLDGFTSGGFSQAPVQVNPLTQEAELWKSSGLQLSRITAADKSGAIGIFCRFEYPY